MAGAFAQYDRQRKLSAPPIDLAALQTLLQQPPTREYKKRFLIKGINKLIAIDTADILFFYSEAKITWLRTRDGQKHAVNYTLDELSDLLDPAAFFRINRQLIVQVTAIQEAIPYSNSRVRIKLPYGPTDDMSIVSRDRVADFKAWWAG